MPYGFDIIVALRQIAVSLDKVAEEIRLSREQADKQVKEHDVQLKDVMSESTLQLIAAFERIGEKTVVAVNEVKEAHDMQAIEVRDFALHWQHREETKEKIAKQSAQWASRDY